MPNHVTTILGIRAHGTRLNEIREFMRGTEPDGGVSEFDFEKVIPQPTELANLGGLPVARFLDAPSVDRMVKYGFEDWMAWNTANRGTKWTAYNVEVLGKDCISFQTAWSHPVKVIQALSYAFSATYFDVEWADEDTGSNLGAYAVKQGVLTPGDFPLERTPESYPWAYRVQGMSEHDIKECLEEAAADKARERPEWVAEVRERAARELEGRELANIMPYIKMGKLRDVWRVACWRTHLFPRKNVFSTCDAHYIAAACKRLLRAGVLTDALTVDAKRVLELGLRQE